MPRWLTPVALWSAVACSGENADANDAGSWDGGVDADAAFDSSEDVPLECATDCDPCPDGDVCIKSGSFNKPIIATCLTPCGSTDECGPGELCLAPGISPQIGKSFCVSESLPAQCGSYTTGHCDFFGHSECHDADTLIRGIDKIGVFCGFELVHCPAGCEEPPLDGGPAPPKCL